MKKFFCLLACLCSFSLNSMGDWNGPFLILVHGFQNPNDCFVQSPGPGTTTGGDEDDKEISVLYSKFNRVVSTNPRDCVIPTPTRNDNEDDRLGRCPISPVPPAKK